jgi:hypothetical protein
MPCTGTSMLAFSVAPFHSLPSTGPATRTQQKPDSQPTDRFLLRRKAPAHSLTRACWIWPLIHLHRWLKSMTEPSLKVVALCISASFPSHSFPQSRHPLSCCRSLCPHSLACRAHHNSETMAPFSTPLNFMPPPSKANMCTPTPHHTYNNPDIIQHPFS